MKCKECEFNINKKGQLGMCSKMKKFVSQNKIHPRCPITDYQSKKEQ